MSSVYARKQFLLQEIASQMAGEYRRKSSVNSKISQGRQQTNAVIVRCNENRNARDNDVNVNCRKCIEAFNGENFMDWVPCVMSKVATKYFDGGESDRTRCTKDLQRVLKDTDDTDNAKGALREQNKDGLPMCQAAFDDFLNSLHNPSTHLECEVIDDLYSCLEENTDTSAMELASRAQLAQKRLDYIDFVYKNKFERMRFTMMNACYGVCVCSVDNIEQYNAMDVYFSAGIDQSKFDVDAVTALCKESLEKEFDTTNSGITANLKSIITKAYAYSTASIRQYAANSVKVEIVGTGATVSRVRQQAVMRGCMSAVIKSESELNLMDKIVTDMIISLRQEIEKTTLNTLQKIWEENKTMWIVLLSVLGGLMIIYPMLIVTKAVNSS